MGLKKWILFIFCVIVFNAQAQDYTVKVKSTEVKIKLDGILEEEWATAELVNGFKQSKPYDSLKSKSITEVKILSDKNFLYIAAICYDTFPGNYIVQSLKRDFSFPRTDAFGVFIDPFQDGSNGFSFAVNPYGSQREGLIAFGGKFGVSTSWDNKWFSAVKKYEDKWVVEMAIPFKTIRYKEGSLEWNINFARNNQKINETSTWYPVPRNFNVAHLAYMGKLKWESSPQKQGVNIVVIPYVLGAYNQNSLKSTEKGKFNAGFDAKIGINPSLNLDLTVNPDFAQVEVDRQVTNLDRFELFFPEKRQFFLENQDLFSNMGTRGFQPFFSRRVGLQPDSNGTQQQVPIILGARLSGKINKNLRIGVLDVQTGNNSAKNTPQNYAMIVAQQKVWKRSTVSAFVVNRQAFDTNRFEVIKKDFNTVTGLNFQYRSPDGKWSSTLIASRSLEYKVKRSGWFGLASLDYDTKNIIARFNTQSVGDGYRADVGFFRRKGIIRFNPYFQYKFYPKSSKINWIGPGLEYEGFTKVNYKLIEANSYAFVEMKLLNTSFFKVSFADKFIELRRAFDPSGKRSVSIPVGTQISFKNLKLEYQTDERRLFFFDGESVFGEYFNGKRFNIKASFRYRIMPYVNLSVLYSYNKIDLPTSFSSSEFNLISPKIELTLKDNLFFTTFIQVNDQIKNINLNARLQWRFKPVSDVFLVYTDNYFPEDFGHKNRAIILKINYWLNL